MMAVPKGKKWCRGRKRKQKEKRTKKPIRVDSNRNGCEKKDVLTSPLK
jgi:hypothetical protein